MTDSIWKPHTTVAAVIERDQRFLMVEERIDGRTVINQPAGHLDPDESLIDAVIRETWEETAWRFHPDALVGVYLWKNEAASDDDKPTFLRFAYTGSVSEHDPEQRLDDEILDAGWFSHAELIERQADLRSPLVLRCIDDHIAGKRFPLELTQWLGH